MKVALAIALFLVAGSIGALRAQDEKKKETGGWEPVSAKDAMVQAAAKFAVKAAIAKEKTGITLTKVVSAESQVVAGINYRVRLQVESPKGNWAEAVIWMKTDKSMELTKWTWNKKPNLGK